MTFENSAATAPRLAPRWPGVFLSAVLSLMLVAGVVVAAVGGHSEQAPALVFGAVGAVGLVLCVVLFWPRRRRELVRDVDGSLTIAAPWAVVVVMIAAWAMAGVVGASLVFTVVTDGIDALESPGAALVLVGALLASLPDAVRLATGRLHRWRVTLAPSGLRYRGYRTDIELPWVKVRGSRLQASRLFRWTGVPESMRPGESGPKGYGVVVDRKGSGPDFLVPQAFFRVPAAQISEEIERFRS
ncbi:MULTISPECIES: hypothetical protein [Nocardioides]|uniref:hypothetical protein n=1 Tax=Nocardioides TaxID=1839 RepID=UPI0004198AE1|nr:MULTISPECIES: hypothetical protein [Nocardioides]